MSLARRAPKRPAEIYSDDDEPGIDNSCSVTSGDEAARAAGSAAADRDVSHVTVSEEGGSGTEAEGKREICCAFAKLSCFISTVPMQMRLCPRVYLNPLRGWNLNAWLLAGHGCHARTAHITAIRCKHIVSMSGHTLARSRSSAVSVGILRDKLSI